MLVSNYSSTVLVTKPPKYLTITTFEGKGSPLYKLDDLKRQVDSEPASIQGGQSAFDFGEEGDKLVEIVTDPLMFPATREAGNVTVIFSGVKTFCW